jgi:hypothetical protein
MHAWRRPGVAALALATLVLVLAAATLFRPQPAQGRQVIEAPNQAVDAPDQAPVTPGYVVAEGRILYIDRESDKSHPAAGLKIEIWDKDNRFPVTGEKLDETVTDASGFFRSKEIKNVDMDGPAGQKDATQDIYLKLFTNNGTIRLFQTGTNREYTWNSYEIDPRDGLATNVPDGTFGMAPLYVMENTPNVEALWTFVNLAEGWLFLKEQTGVSPGEITAYWAKTSTDGPRYDSTIKALFYRNDNAGYADVVVQQEAYALAHNLLGTLPADWQGCLAGPGETAKSPSAAACAFIQGWATFFPLAVYSDAEFDSPGLRGDFDAARAGTPGWSDGDLVAARIAGAFWDLYEDDPTPDGFDMFNATFIDMWDVIRTAKPTTMAEWWAGWKAAGKDSCSALGSLFQNTIDYNTKPQITPIPDVVLNEDETRSFDLNTYVTDAECSGDKLQFRMVSAGDVNAGVILMPMGVISITPVANWFGETTVRLEASDGPSVTPISFKVTVVPINDCPVISPPVDDPGTARYKEPIVVNLLPHGTDVEDQPALLRWDARIPQANEADIRVDGRGTTTLTFTLLRDTIEMYSVRIEIVVKDRDGCETTQPLVLTWDSRPNQPPFIWWDKFRREYTAPKNVNISVDLRDIAGDDEDGPDTLEWFVDAKTLEHAQFGYASPDNKQVLVFEPELEFIGSDQVNIDVKDSGGLSARAAITLTWTDPDLIPNSPPQIHRNLLVTKTGGLNSTVCYDLSDKAADADDPITSLRWFASGYDTADMSVNGMGSREMCFSPIRYNFAGCIPANFIVRDPHGAEDNHIVSTCWKKIEVVFPIITHNIRFR